MHEYTIVQALLDRVAEAARGYDAPRVTEVRVRIGELAGVETALLRKAYDVFREPTLCRDAALVIESAAARWACPRCSRDIAGRRRPALRAVRSPGDPGRGRRDRARARRHGGAVMCGTCGCSESDRRIVAVDLHDSILAANDRQAAHNREHFRASGTLAINLMGSPGSGKTALLEATAAALGGRRSIAAMSGDLATDRDAERLRAAGIPAVAITTGSACHLDAEMVHEVAASSAPRIEAFRIRRPAAGRSPLHRECRQPGLPRRLRPRPELQRGGARGDGGRGQAAQVPGHVPARRSGGAHQDRSTAVSRWRQRRGSAHQPRARWRPPRGCFRCRRRPAPASAPGSRGSRRSAARAATIASRLTRMTPGDQAEVIAHLSSPSTHGGAR